LSPLYVPICYIFPPLYWNMYYVHEREWCDLIIRMGIRLPSGYNAFDPIQSMAQVSLAAVFTQDDLNQQEAYNTSDESTSTPVLRISKGAITDGYDSVCIPLTNEAWRTRWKRMCLTVDEKQTPEIEKLAEDWRASEGPFLKSEMNITRLGRRVF